MSSVGLSFVGLSFVGLSSVGLCVGLFVGLFVAVEGSVEAVEVFGPSAEHESFEMIRGVKEGGQSGIPVGFGSRNESSKP